MKRLIIITSLAITSISLNAQSSLPVVQSCNDFALSAFMQLVANHPEKNVIFSPVSLNIALRMVAGGAKENTLSQICKAACSDEDPLFIHSNIKDLLSVYKPKNKDIDLQIANGIWIQEKYPVLPEFLELTQNLYAAPCKSVDFTDTKNRIKTKTEINQWVAEQTKGNFQNLLDDKAFSANSKLVIINAIFFKGNWLHPFSTDLTHTGTFTLLSGKSQPANFMHQKNNFRYAETKWLQIIELPYKESAFTLIIILPKTDKYQQVESSLSSETIDSLLNEAKPMQVNLSIPKFKMEYGADFSETMEAIGISDAFGKNADFSGIDGNKELYISKVIHKSTITIDEKGTEAAGATAAIMDRKMAIDQTVDFDANRSFIYFIRDNQSGVLLFTGRYVTVP